MLLTKQNISIGLLLLFHLVGIGGLYLETSRSLFLSLTPFNLVLTTVVFIWANENYSRKFLLLSGLIFLIGFGVEVAGVHTGWLFGAYNYGSPLGAKLFDVPLTIGLNWLVLAFAARSIIATRVKNGLALAVGSATLMTLLDFIIEPVAIKLDFWHWVENNIPLQNYLMWWITSFVIQLLLNAFSAKIQPRLGAVVFGVQTLFFGVLNLLL